MQRHLSILIGLVLFQVVPLASASEGSDPIFPQEVRREIAKALRTPLPSIQEMILPGLNEAPDSLPGLAVGNLVTSSVDGLPWGRAVGELLRWKIPFGPRLLLRTPHPERDRFFADLGSSEQDVEKAGTTLEELAPLFQRVGVENALTGSIRIGSETFSLQLRLHSLPSKSLRKELNAAGELESLPQTLGELSVQVLEEIGVSLDTGIRESISCPTPQTIAQLRRFAEILALKEQNPVTESWPPAQALWDEGALLPALGTDMIVAWYSNLKETEPTFLARLEELRTRFPDHCAIASLVMRYQFGVEPLEGKHRTYDSYRAVAESNPADLIALLRLSDAALNERQDARAAISISLHTAEAFPRNYRSWWSLSSCLQSAIQPLIQEAVGANPQGSMRLIELLQRYSARAFERALQLYPNSIDLLRFRLGSIWDSEGFSEEYWSIFDAIVEAGIRDPEFFDQVNNGLGYAGTGDFEEVRKVLTASLRRVPLDGVNLKLFDHLQKAFEGRDWAGEVDPAVIYADAEAVAQALLEMVSRGRKASAIVGSLEACLRCGANDRVLEIARARFQSMKEGNSSNRQWSPWCAELAIGLGDGDLAEACLNEFKERSSAGTPNLEDYLSSLRALIPSRRGDPGKSKEELEQRIAEAEDNIYSCLRYLELGLNHPIDDKVKQECTKYLIDLAPEEFPHETGPSIGMQSLQPEMIPRYIQDLLRWMAKGHLASLEGDHVSAEKYYMTARRAQRALKNRSSATLTPDPMVHLWRERRALAGREPLK